MEVRKLKLEEVTRSLFAAFHRHQTVTRCWRKREGEWRIEDNPFEEDWSEADYRFLVKCLRNTIATGGAVFGAFDGEVLKGFASVEPVPLGSRGQYLELSSLHVSEECRHHGTGRALLAAAKAWAGDHGGEKLYISAHSAVESQAFYRAMGCREAEESPKPHAEREPWNCQMELIISDDREETI